MYSTSMANTSKPGLRTKSKQFIRRHFLPRTCLTEQEKYFKDGGNALLYPWVLPRDSICVDIGAYLGDYIKGYLDKNNLGRILAFEPIPQYYTKIIDEFGDNPQVSVFPYALSSESGWIQVIPNGAATTLVPSSNNSLSETSIQIRCELFSILNILIPEGKIDWVKINIEGAEYQLLRYLDLSSSMKRIKTLVVQFHHIDGENLTQMHALLSKTHTMCWGYNYVWERWDVN